MDKLKTTQSILKLFHLWKTTLFRSKVGYFLPVKAKASYIFGENEVRGRY